MISDCLEKVIMAAYRKFEISFRDIKEAQLRHGCIHLSYRQYQNSDGLNYRSIFEIFSNQKEVVFSITVNQDHAENVKGYLVKLLKKNNIINISCYNEFEKAINKGYFLNSLKEENGV